MTKTLKKFIFVITLMLAGCHAPDDFSGINFFNPPKSVTNQAAELAKDMYLCETYWSNSSTSENYLTYPGNYFRYSKTQLPTPDQYEAERAKWQDWTVLTSSKSRIVAYLPKGTRMQIENYKKPNHYDEMFGDKTEEKITILSGAYKGKTVIVTTTFLKPAT